MPPRGFRLSDVEESARNEFFYYGEHDLFAIRYRNWKIDFQVKDDWFAGQLKLSTVPQPVNLRVDPFERRMQAPFYPLYVGEALDCHAGWLHPPDARENVRGLSPATGPNELESDRDAVGRAQHGRRRCRELSVTLP